VEEEVVIGGRCWIVKDSTLGVGIGYGLFACEDIDVPANLGQDMQYAPALFPYAGPVYSARAWKILLSQAPTWKVYQLDMDRWPGSHKRIEHTRTIDSDPIRYPNIAGYINSTQGTKPKRSPNVEWVTVAGSPPPPFYSKEVDDHIMTVAIRPIKAGEEFFCDYEWEA
jgi:SET domain